MSRLLLPMLLSAIVGLPLTTTAAASPRQGEATEAGDREPTPGELEAWRIYLRARFEDIHDVSMRFHMEDPMIGGLIGLRMTWQGGRLVAGEVVENETGNEAEGEALLDAIRGWTVDGLQGPVTFQSAFQIRLVGSDDPEFPQRSIVTGSVLDPQGQAVTGATIRFEPQPDIAAAVPDARSNREGIFVRTLIPPGAWTVAVNADGFVPYRSEPITLDPGSHHIERVVLTRRP